MEIQQKPLLPQDYHEITGTALFGLSVQVSVGRDQLYVRTLEKRLIVYLHPFFVDFQQTHKAIEASL